MRYVDIYGWLCVCVSVCSSSSKRALARLCVCIGVYICACMLTYANGVCCCGRLVLYTVHLNYILHSYSGKQSARSSIVGRRSSLSLARSFFFYIIIFFC